jgi:hypothetical protein
MKGIELKKALGLEKFEFCYIQKVLGISVPIFFVTVDSRRPTVYLTMYKVNTSKSTIIRRLKRATGDFYFLNKFVMSPPLLIERSTVNVLGNAIIIIRDLAGEYLRNMDFYPKKKIK